MPCIALFHSGLQDHGCWHATVRSAVQNLDCHATEAMQYTTLNKMSCVNRSISDMIDITGLQHVGNGDCRPCELSCSSSQSQDVYFNSKCHSYTRNLNSETSGDSKNAFLHCGDGLVLHLTKWHDNFSTLCAAHAGLACFASPLCEHSITDRRTHQRLQA